MIIVDVTCANCPAHLRLLCKTKTADDGSPTTQADAGDVIMQLADRRWTLRGPLCSDCADKMRKTIN